MENQQPNNPNPTRLTNLEFLTILDKLITERGTEDDRQYLLNYFDDPNNIDHFSLLFSTYVTKEVPPFHQEIYKLYQEKGFKGVAAPRGFAKSTITDLIYLGWCAITGKKHFIILISDTYTQAGMFLESFQTEIENNPIINWLYPNIQGEAWGGDELIVNGYNNTERKRTVCCILPKGAGMKIRGLRFRSWRPDLVIIDDLENDEMVESADRRMKTRRWLLKAVIPGLSKDGDLVMIGTILHFDSVLKNITEHKEDFGGWKTKLYQAISNNQSLWPEHYTLEELQSIRSNPKDPKYIGPLTFSQEYQNTPLDDNERIFRPDWLDIRYNYTQKINEFILTNPTEGQTWENTFFKRIISGVDPAISEKTTADYFAMITIGIAKDDGHIYILDYFKDRIGDPIKQVEVIINSYLRWHQDTIKIEAVAYQMGLYQLVKRLGAEKNIYPPITPFKPDKDKVRRAIIHSANFAGKLIHLREDHTNFNDFYTEILEFPLGTHDDMLDAFMNAADETVMQNRPRVFYNKPTGF